MIETECQRRIAGPTTFYVYRNQRHRRGHLLLVGQIYSELVLYRYRAFAVMVLLESILFGLTD